ncbi:hypothetical protein [Marinicella sp. W31]|uniref:hypothetical protein n=1 Tax=Marinicella sp. W31 TaxID=3023713 RepID=UPI003757EC8B
MAVHLVIMLLIGVNGQILANEVMQTENIWSEQPQSLTDESWQSLRAAIQETVLSVSEFDDFGGAVDLDPDFDQAVIGVYGDSDSGIDSGRSYVFEREGNEWVEKANLTASDSEARLEFGYSLAIEGDWLAVGAPAGFLNDGRVYIFHKDNGQWSEHSKLVPNKTSTFINRFGFSLDMVGERLVVGNTGGISLGGTTGSVEVYEYDSVSDGWMFSEKITSMDGVSGDGFGRNLDLDISGDRIIVGSAGHDFLGDNAGAAYVFDYDGSGWVQSAKILGSAIEDGHGFGHRVSINGNLIAITDSVSAFATENVYVFELLNDQWQETAILSSSSTSAFTRFGSSIETGRDIVAVSQFSPRAIFVYEKNISNEWVLGPDIVYPGGNSGLDGIVIEGDRMLLSNGNVTPVYLEKENPNTCGNSGCNWLEEGRIENVGTTGGDMLGSSLSISGNYAVVGAPGDDDQGTEAGAAVVFEYGIVPPFSFPKWVIKKKLTAENGQPGDHFGKSVSVDGDRIVVGAPNRGAGVFGDNNGSAYVFERVAGQWVETDLINADIVDLEEGQLFGSAVKVHGDFLMIGAPGHDSGTGAVYEFRKDLTQTWFQRDKLKASDGNIDNDFGAALDFKVYEFGVVSGDIIGGDLIVGSPKYDTSLTSDTGAAYVFNLISSGNPEGSLKWAEAHKIENIQLNDRSFFGGAISLGVDRVMIGASGDRATADNTQGGVYMYTYEAAQDQWLLEDELNASVFNQQGELEFAQFGLSVSLNGDRALVGAPAGISGNGATGRAFMFDLNSATGDWRLVEEITQDSLSSDDLFGSAVGLTNDWIMVGVAGKSIQGADAAGQVNVFVDDVIFKNGYE